MSEPAREATDTGLHGAVRPFRLAAFELTAPLAGLEVALGAAAALAEVLQPPLGQLDVSPFGSLAVGEAGAAVAAARGPAGKARTRRPAVARRSATARPAASPSTPAGGGLAGAFRAIERFQKDVAVSSTAEAIVAGSGPAAVGIARAVEGVTSLPLIGELAEAAIEAVAQPAPAPTGRARGPRGAAEQAPRAGRSPVSQAGGPAAPAAPAGGAFGGIARALEEIQRDAAVSAAAEQVLPGTGRTAVALTRGAEAAKTLLEQLAETALEAVAPGAPSRPVAGRGPRRSEAAEDVRRELDAAAPAPRAPARNGRPTAPETGARRPDTRAPVEDGAAATRDPAELAWLVNEALVEQARRHGVDLS